MMSPGWRARCWRLFFGKLQAGGQSFAVGLERLAPQAVAGEIDAMGVVNQPIEDGVGISRVADEGVPFVDRNLAGEDGRATSVAFLEDFVEVTTGTGVERFEAPIVEDEELDTGEAAQDAGISAVTAGEREFGDRSAYRSSWHSLIRFSISPRAQ